MSPAERRALHAAMIRFSDGDRSAFDEVFAGLWPLVRAVAARALPDPRDAEDAAQQALLTVCARIVDLDPARDGVAWAVTLTAWEVRTLRQRARRRREDGPPAEHHASADDPEETAAARELATLVSALVGALEPRDRKALELALQERPATDETGRKRRQRAFGRLRDAWRRLHG